MSKVWRHVREALSALRRDNFLVKPLFSVRLSILKQPRYSKACPADPCGLRNNRVVVSSHREKVI